MRTIRQLCIALGILLVSVSAVAQAQPGQDEPISPYDSTAESGEDDVAQPPRPVRMAEKAFLRHVPPTEAASRKAIRLLAVIEAAWIEDGLIAYYRIPGEDAYKEVDFERSSAGGYFARIPGSDVGREGVEYYIAGRKSALHFASAQLPHRVRVEPRSKDRWIEVEKQRLGERRYAVAASLGMLDFGSTHGSDRYLQGHLDWSHLLVDNLYSIHLGFGFLEGKTPEGTMEGALVEKAGVRYGYGGVRYRLRDKVWFDSKAMMGFGQDGFAIGVGGALTLGNDWRTAVTVGAEAMTELSYKAWLRLQWDTVPGVLMSATVATTNQPDAKIDAGSYVEFKVRYPLSESFELAGTASFASRGNRPGGFGGGLQSRYMF